MSTQSQAQVTHQIIRLFETSKLYADEDLDCLPGIYAIVDQNGKIYKGNKFLGTLFSVNYEYLLNLDLSKLFLNEDWVKLRTTMDSCTQSESTINDVQLNLTVAEKQFNYLWNVTSMRVSRPDVPVLFKIIGRDITDLIRTSERNARMGLELETAGIIQKALFPAPEAEFGKSSISGFSMSATECGGDWWYYNLLGDKLFLWIGDVEGHGVPAALITSAVRAAVALIDKIDSHPSKILPLLSHAVLSVATEHKVMTFCLASIDLKSGELIFSSAAHEAGYLIRAKADPYTIEDVIALESNASYPLGLSATYTYEEYSVKLERGDRVIFHTDGVFDIENEVGKRWAKNSLHRTLIPMLSASTGAVDLTNLVKSSIADFKRDTPLIDDVTFVVFQF